MSNSGDNSGDHPAGDVTQLLQSWQAGDLGALDELLPLIYDDLDRIAASYLRQERANHTLQATALVNEAYLRLKKRYKVPLNSRNHFLAAAAKTMRQILVDHARRLSAAKRIGPGDKVTLEDISVPGGTDEIDLMALDQALDRLAQANERHASVVELRFFGGLSEPEVAEILGVSLPTVQRDWKVARITLRHWMEQTP